jgi:uncharacterized membrane protein
MSTEIVVAVFPSRSLLTKALDHITNLKEFGVKRAAIIAKAVSGETVVLDDDIGADEAGVAGGTLGAAITALGLVQMGALTLPGIGAIIALGAGVLVGGLLGRTTGRFAANLLDFGFKNAQIEALAAKLQAGRPALVLEIVATESNLFRIRQELNLFQGEFLERDEYISADTPG